MSNIPHLPRLQPRISVTSTITTIIEDVPPTFAYKPLELGSVMTPAVDDVKSMITMKDKQGDTCRIIWRLGTLQFQGCEWLSRSRLKIVQTMRGNEVRYGPAISFGSD